MKKIFIASLISINAAVTAHAAIPWWQQPTICRLDPTNCYPSMGSGFDTELWDADSNCWGMKLICPDAVTSGTLSSYSSDAYPMGKQEIASGDRINRDFDTNVLNGDCFGARKTMANGSMASVNGKFVNVWCNGILDNPDEILPSGEITFGAQPTCNALSQNGYVASLNGRCYGKYYDMAEYFIECDGTSLLPSRLIILNGADYNSGITGAPSDKNAADVIFDKMYSTSKAQHAKYYKDE